FAPSQLCAPFLAGARPARAGSHARARRLDRRLLSPTVLARARFDGSSRGSVLRCSTRGLPRPWVIRQLVFRRGRRGNLVGGARAHCEPHQVESAALPFSPTLKAPEIFA